MRGRLQAVRPRIGAHIPVDAAGVQIDACAEYHGFAVIDRSRDGFHTPAYAVLHHQLGDFCLLNGQVIRIFQHAPHGTAVFAFVGLGPERMNGRSFGFIQHLRLNKGFINIFSHFAAQGVDFPDQMSLGGSSDVGIAGHQGNAVYADREQNDRKPQTGARQSRFAARMSCAYDDYIIKFFNY